MENQQGKVKIFFKKHSQKIKVGTIMLGAVILNQYLCKKSYKDGLINGGRMGASIAFEETIKWCDNEFEDIQLEERWNTWMKDNPDKVESINYKVKA